MAARKSYNKAFKEEAVRLAEKSGATQVARAQFSANYPIWDKPNPSEPSNIRLNLRVGLLRP